MVRENYRGMGGRWCTKTAAGWVGDGARKPSCVIVYKNRRSMVRENHCGMGGRWCTKTDARWARDSVREPPLGGWAMVYKDSCWIGARWCVKTTFEHGALVLNHDRLVLENYRWEAACRCSFTTCLGQQEHHAA